MNKKIIIVGAFHEIIELVEENGLNIVGMIDDKKKKSYRNYKIIGKDKEADKLTKAYKNALIVITPDKPKVREKLFLYYCKLGFKFISLVSDESHISKSATLGQGVIIQYGVNVSSECYIGNFVKLNTKSNVMHDSFIGDFTTISPNAVILGNVKIGERCYIGANATVLPNIKICADTIIGAGAVVTKDIKVPATFIGVPARQLKK